VIFQKIDYHKYRKFGFWSIILTIVLLLSVFIPGISHPVGTAHRWIGLANFYIQPAEIAKLTFVIYLASWFSQRREHLVSFWKGFLPFILILALITSLVFLEPDFGTSSVFIFIALTVYFTAGANLWHLGILGTILLAISYIFVKLAPYRINRILAFLNPQKDVLGIAYHINQAIIAIGSGGLLGLGFGNSFQKYNFLPAAHTDSIFAIICEELGFLRAILILGVFGFILYRGYLIAKNAPDDLGRFLAVGIVGWIIFQTLINLAAMLGLVPLTGVPLPFVSYGGTSLVVTLSAVGILLNISKQVER